MRSKAQGVGVGERVPELAVGGGAEQVYERAECDELTEGRHVDAVAVGVAYRRRGRRDDDALGTQPVEHREYRVLHRVAAHDGIVENDERVVFFYKPVCDIVDMLVEFAPRRGVSDEGSELRILHRNFPEAREAFDRIYKIYRIFGVCGLAHR